MLTVGWVMPAMGDLATKVASDIAQEVFIGVVTSLRQVLKDQCANKVDAGVCDHSVSIAEGPAIFKIAQTHNVCFLFKKDTVAENKNIGQKEPLTSWNPEIIQLRWQVRWTAKGLMPAKLALHLTG